MFHMQITELRYDCFDPILPFWGEKSSKIESGIYYYHADHLGSSSVVTDKNGKFHEHLEYFPYGETWINDRANNENLPYRFTGKELDPETGLYYFGARYFDARLSRWISVDPILNSYLDGKPSGGIYSPDNLDLYNYCGNNPVKFVDPDGKHKWKIKYGTASEIAALQKAGKLVYVPIVDKNGNIIGNMDFTEGHDDNC